MKNFYLLLLAIFIFSCSKENISEPEMVTLDASVAEKSYFIGHWSYPVECPPENGEAVTDDLRVVLSEPLPYDTTFEFRLFKLTSGTSGWSEMISPFIVMAPAGSTEIRLASSCELPHLVDCGENTGTYSDSFKIQFKTAEYFRTTETFDYVAGGADYTTVTAYRYCLGGGWDDDGGSGPEEPGGLN